MHISIQMIKKRYFCRSTILTEKWTIEWNVLDMNLSSPRPTSHWSFPLLSSLGLSNILHWNWKYTDTNDEKIQSSSELSIEVWDRNILSLSFKCVLMLICPHMLRSDHWAEKQITKKNEWVVVGVICKHRYRSSSDLLLLLTASEKSLSTGTETVIITWITIENITQLLVALFVIPQPSWEGQNFQLTHELWYVYVNDILHLQLDQ